jgi:DNA-binding winged helix-turn-helix (wHTH) protein/TolB-like protein
MNAGTSRTFAVNGVIVDVAEGLLRDRKGREIALRPQAFDLLKYFLENPGRLVTKDELMKVAWPDVFVTDDSLVQCVRDIRRALNDHGQSIVKAVPKRGYRLVLRAAAESTIPDRRRRWLAPAVALAVLAVGAVGALWAPVQRPAPSAANFPAWEAANFARIHFMMGRYRESLAMIDRLDAENDDRDTSAFKAGSLAALGRLPEARAVSQEAVASHPDLSIEALINDSSYDAAGRQRLIDTLRLAGIPPCARPGVLVELERPRRLPECRAKQVVKSRSPGSVPFVAVLPIINVAGDEASQRLAIGIRKELHRDLARFREFQVVLRGPDYFPLSDPANVSFVVGGAIRREDEGLRIAAQLFDAKTGNLLWSERWNRPDQGVFAIRTEISNRIAGRLGGNSGLIQEAGLTAARRKPAGDLTAYDLYLLGVERLERGNRADIEEAIGLLDRSARLAPELVRAWLEISLARETLAEFGVESERNRQAASAAARRAVELDPRDAKAHAALAVSLAYGNDFARARSEFDAALHLAPDALDVLTLYAAWASRFGEPGHGAETVDRIVALEPVFPASAARQFSRAYFMAGRYEDALTMIDRLSTDSYSGLTWAMHAAALAAIGQADDARKWVAKAQAARPDLSIETMAHAPGLGDAERRRLVDTMRLAGFPALREFRLSRDGREVAAPTGVSDELTAGGLSPR